MVQYQKNEGPAASNGGNAGQTSDYRFDITIKDDTGFQIGQALLQDAPTAVGDAVDSALPDALIVTAGQDDNDPVSFAYASQSWTSDDDQCSAGQYDSGSRNMDCGFDCSTTETSDV